jgi:uncharacterized protein (DUF3084 family)
LSKINIKYLVFGISYVLIFFGVVFYVGTATETKTKKRKAQHFQLRPRLVKKITSDRLDEDSS